MFRPNEGTSAHEGRMDKHLHMCTEGHTPTCTCPCTHRFTHTHAHGRKNNEGKSTWAKIYSSKNREKGQAGFALGGGVLGSIRQRLHPHGSLALENPK